MFKVKSKYYGGIIEVYAVDREQTMLNGATRFLMFDKIIGWHWELADKFLPLQEDNQSLDNAEERMVVEIIDGVCGGGGSGGKNLVTGAGYGESKPNDK